MNDLIGYTVEAVDGANGSVADFLFDDRRRMVRYALVRTGGWLFGREVLISPVSIDTIDIDSQRILTVLDKVTIEQAPGIDSSRPVSRQKELELVSYFNWPAYWAPVRPPSLSSGEVAIREIAEKEFDPHLRSAKEVECYAVNGMTDCIGHFENLIVDIDTWAVRYLVINTADWLSGRKVVASFDWLTDICWDDRSVSVDLTRDQMRAAPQYDPLKSLDRDYESKLYSFYGHPTYW
jgi:hypothetical protein